MFRIWQSSVYERLNQQTINQQQQTNHFSGVTATQGGLKLENNEPATTD